MALVLVGCSGGGTNNSQQFCPQLARADISALLAQPVSTVNEVDIDSELLECDTDALQIQLNLSDADKTLYDSANNTPADTHALQGFGDEGYWSAIGSGTGVAQSTPSVVIHKGNATCALTANDVASDLSMPYSQTPPPFGIQTSDCDAWAKKAAKVCVEYFTAAGL